MKIKVGIPRALYFYEIFILWKAFFRALRVELIISDSTSETILREGTKYLSHEFCLPVRAFIGHVINLLEKKVDYVFVPRSISLEHKSYTCPKMMALPDIVKNVLRNERELKILSLNIDLNYNRLTLFRRYWWLGIKLTGNPIAALFAAVKLLSVKKKMDRDASQGRTRFQTFEKFGFNPFEFEHKHIGKKHLKVGVTGFSYILYDKYLSHDLLNNLGSMGVEVVTAEMLPLNLIEEELKELPKLMPWHLARRIYGAAIHFLKEKEYDGLINLSCAGCGPSSKVDKLIELRMKEKRSNPLLQLHLNSYVDEVTLAHKLKEFVDNLKLKNALSLPSNDSPLKISARRLRGDPR